MTDERLHYYAPATQTIANRLPPHSDIRRKKTSVGQEFLSGAVGVHVQDIFKQVNQGVADFFLVSAGLNEPDQLRVVKLPDETERPTVETNLVRNGLFGLWASDTRGPDEWTITGTFEKVSGAFSADSLKLTASATLSQKRDAVVRTGSSINGSIWYRSTTGAVATLVLKGTTDNGTVVSNGAQLTSGINRWTRVSVTLTPTENIVDYTLELNVTTGIVSVDGAQVVLGTRPQSWRPSIFDKLRWYNFPEGPVLPPIALEFGRHVQIVEEVRDFWLSPPTRIEVRGVRTHTVQPRPAGYTTEIDHTGDSFLTEWVPNGSQVRRIGIARQSADVYGDFDLLFPATKEGQVESISVVSVEATAFFNGYLWVVLTAPAFDGQVRRMLAVVNPNYPRPKPSELQVICAYILDTPSITNMRFKFSDPLWLYMHDGTSEYGIRMFYDYAIYVSRELQVYFREENASVVPIEMAPRRRNLELHLTRQNA